MAKVKNWRREITRIRKLHEVKNDMCHNFYFEVWCRCYDTETHYWSANFVVWFDVFDLQEHYNAPNGVSQKQIGDYAKECAVSFLDGCAPRKAMRGRFIREDRERFYKACAETINNYNGVR